MLKFFDNIDWLQNEPENHCFCRDPPEDCPPKGTMDLSMCIGVPILGSKPHLLDADPKLLEGVDGLEPNEAEHDVFIHFELVCFKFCQTISWSKIHCFSYRELRFRALKSCSLIWRWNPFGITRFLAIYRRWCCRWFGSRKGSPWTKHGLTSWSINCFCKL